MKFAVLGSSSKGNCSIIQFEKGYSILIDAGLKLNEILLKMKKLNIDPNSIMGIYITHAHDDHIKHLAKYLQLFKCKLYIHSNTFKSKEKLLKKYFSSIVFLEYDELVFNNDYSLYTFENYHTNSDNSTCDCLGLCFRTNKKKLTYITDTGKITKTMIQYLHNVDLLAIESNYDISLIKTDNKRDLRTLTTGHLGNQQVKKILKMYKPRKTVLLHISKKNNSEDLIKKEFKDFNVTYKYNELMEVTK